MGAFLTGSIARRLYGLLVLFGLGFAGIVTYQLVELRNNLDSFKRTEIQSVVQAGANVAQSYYDRAKAGEFSMDEAQARARETLRQMRYQDGGYLFIDSFSYINIMHADKPKKEGSDRTNEADGRGKLYLREMIDNAKANGSAYESYLLEAPKGGFFDKVTYAQAFAPWKWVISSGVLLTTVEAIFLQAAVTSAAITTGAILALLGLGTLIVRGITKPLGRLNASMIELAHGRHDIDLRDKGRADEIGDMARTVEVFRENGLKMAQMTEAEAATLLHNQAERSQMMADLQAAFGTVIDAAVAGDFSRRVEAEFPDAELQTLAQSVNRLVATVDQGIGVTGEVLGALARADLTRRVEGDFAGALGQLQDNTNRVAQNLSEVMTRLRGTSRSLKAATGEILSGANDLSERTTRQAATIEETSATMEQLAATVGENTARATEASSIAGTLTGSADASGQVMTQANEAMAKITASSGKISSIIGLIDDIAFQTNLLALNASVEAARAGEAGKGFAVVAVEVRRLAQSAAEASKEIKQLIVQSGGEVQSGSRLVADAAARLQAMLAAARQNSALMEGIARHSKAQSSAIEEINTAVRQMDEMTQHNAALVEQTNAAIEQTEAQASELDEIVDVFTLAPAQPQPARQARRLRANGNAAIDRDWAEF